MSFGHVDINFHNLCIVWLYVWLPFNPLDSKGNYNATSKISWYIGRWWVGCYIWYSEEGPGRVAAPPSPLLAVPNVTAHPSTASVPIAVLLYHGPLLYGLTCRLWLKFTLMTSSTVLDLHLSYSIHHHSLPLKPICVIYLYYLYEEQRWSLRNF